ncbi:MAG: DNA polymerase III subunit alpha, partial [Candidatus Moranbacteria bacterium]|nr:DNA polymerase III subunit alpha [Candidatus Moranbacteria bacterium]
MNNRYFPAFVFPEGHNADSFLKLEVYRGLARDSNISADGLDEKTFIEAVEKQAGAKDLERLKYEMGIISQKGYSAYFLIVADFVNWSKMQGIISTTRGSAAGSFASYCLGITTINPLKYNLPFERFLNPFRPSPPDIDMDFADNRRDEVIAYVTEKYGKDHVAQIVTFGTMAARGSVRDVARALGFPYAKGDTLAKLIPMGSQGFPMTIANAKKITPELEALYNNDPDTKKILDFAEKLEGSPRHASVHAAGIVISPKKLTCYSPLQREAKGGRVITQLEMGSIEKVGLVKMDFLGIRNLSILGNAVKIIEKTKNTKIDIGNLPLDDKKTFDLLASGKTMGLFQLGGAGMTKYLKELKPTTIFDIMAMVALFRPGPMNSIPEFIQRKHNPALIKYLDPRMKDILNMSYGIITYQDDVLLIAIELAGYTWEEADKLRKAMGKKIVEEMAHQKIKFIDGAIAKGMTKEKAQELFKLIEPFAAYGFNKAHAASYAHVAYQTAYLKANFPAEYMAALMTAESGDNETIADAVVECKNMGIEVLAPDINESLKTFTYINDKTIRFGLLAIKNVGEKFVENLVKERKAKGKFKSIEDFVERTPAEDLNKKSMESLIKAGALDQFGERKMLLDNLEQIMTHAREVQKAKNSGQVSLFGEIAAVSLPALRMKATAPATKKEKLAWEKELMGLYISEHPLGEYQKYFNGGSFTPIKNINAEYANREIKIGGIITKVRQITTKTGKPMAFAAIEDMDGKMEAVVFPKIYEKKPDLWQADKILKISGKVQVRDNAFTLLANEAKEINAIDIASADLNSNNDPAPNTDSKIQVRGPEPTKIRKPEPAKGENQGTKKEIHLRLTGVKNKNEEIVLLKKIKDL